MGRKLEAGVKSGIKQPIVSPDPAVISFNWFTSRVKKRYGNSWSSYARLVYSNHPIENQIFASVNE
jgi:hypothetical protein